MGVLRCSFNTLTNRRSGECQLLFLFLMHVSAFHELDKEWCQLPTVTESLHAVSKHVYVVFDASGFGLGAVLLQKHRQMMAFIATGYVRLSSRVLFGRRSCLKW